jgi:hypothetical protein
MTKPKDEMGAIDQLTLHLSFAHGIAATAAAASMNREDAVAPTNLYHALEAVVEHLRQVRDAFDVLEEHRERREVQTHA